MSFTIIPLIFKIESGLHERDAATHVEAAIEAEKLLLFSGEL